MLRAPAYEVTTSTYRLALIDHLFLLRWLDVPTDEAVETLLREMRAARERVGRRLVYVSIIGAHVAVPSGLQKVMLARFGARASAWVDEVHLVFEGSGFKHAAQRSVVTALYFLKRSVVPVSVHGSVQAALQMLSWPTSSPKSELWPKVAQLGFFDP